MEFPKLKFDVAVELVIECDEPYWWLVVLIGLCDVPTGSGL